MTQGTTNSEWSTTGSFKTKRVGYNRPGELYDPLSGETLGERIGGISFVSGEGLRVDNENSYVRYQLAQTLSSGEMSVEVKGLRPNVPGAGGGSKYKVFSMMDGTGDLIASRYQLSVQYRGLEGNPDNCVSFKAVWGDRDVKLEPDLGQRTADVRSLDPSRWYLWTATWNPTAFRLVIRVDGADGRGDLRPDDFCARRHRAVRAVAALRVPRRQQRCLRDRERLRCRPHLPQSLGRQRAAARPRSAARSS